MLDNGISWGYILRVYTILYAYEAEMAINEELFPTDLPVLVKAGGTVPRTVRIHPKKRKHLKDLGIKRLNPQQRGALENFYRMQQDPERGSSLPQNKKDAAMDAGYSESGAIKAMDRLLERKSIVEALDKAGVTDEKIAEVIMEGLESEHPLKPGRPDPHAIIKFVIEANKIKDNHPATKVKISKESRSMVVHMTTANIDQFEKYQRMRGVRVTRNPDRS